MSCHHWTVEKNCLVYDYTKPDSSGAAIKYELRPYLAIFWLKAILANYIGEEMKEEQVF